MLNNMFSNAGEKIKTVSKAFFLIGLFLSIGGWLVLMVMGIVYDSAAMMAQSLLVLLLGIFVSWFNSLLLYAFGCLIANSDTIAEKCENAETDFPFGPST